LNEPAGHDGGWCTKLLATLQISLHRKAAHQRQLFVEYLDATIPEFRAPVVGVTELRDHPDSSDRAASRSRIAVTPREVMNTSGES
jgi:hypothetical protein